MSEIKNQDRILEAIDQLRRRKSRPDADRICNFLLRRFCVGTKETQADLKRLLEAKTVIEVKYKGSTSYRNAAKWVKLLKEKNNDFSSIISGALSELIVHEPDYLDEGVPPSELEKYIFKKNKEIFNKKDLDACIKREVKSGKLLQLENGNYSLVDYQQSSSLSPQNSISNTGEIAKMVTTSTRAQSSEHSSTEPPKKEKKSPKRPVSKHAKILRESRKTKASNLENETTIESSSNDSTKKDTDDSENATSSTASGANRLTRRKRAAKKVFDPSDNNLPKRKRGRPLGSRNKDSRDVKDKDDEDTSQDSNHSAPKGYCYVCQRHSITNKQGQRETLIGCRDCTIKAHPVCIARDEKQHASPWQCYQCKTCCVCSETDEYETMLVCRVCDDAYHMSCHIPIISNKFMGAFHCSRCVQSKNKLDTKQEPVPMDSVSRSTPSPPSSVSSPSLSSPIPNSSSGISSFNEDALDEENVPDASSWSVPQVASYLRHRGYHMQAKVFEEHEIDGQALLLMKRSDVLSGLRMKLGPALKAYKQVKRLQIRSSDITLLWASL